MFKRYILLFCVLTAVAIFPALCEEMPVVNDEKIVVLDDQPDVIRNAQRCLINLGFLKGYADGAYGPKTAAAIRSFQQQNNLPETGHLDEDTYALLTQSSSPDHTTAEIQQRLIDLGYLYGGTADGWFGARSVEALKAFQNLNGLAVTGTADTDTLSALFSTQAKALPTALFVGCRGDKVTTLQTCLKLYGFFTGKADGDYGQSTANAVLSFQRHLVAQGITDGINPNGTATSTTLYHLYDPGYSSFLEDISLGSTGKEVRRIEKRLGVLGYMDAGADEAFDEYAVEALELFQTQSQLPVTGVADQKTVDAMFASDAPVAERCVLHGITPGEKGLVVREVEKALLTYGLTVKLPNGKYDEPVAEALALLPFPDTSCLSLEAVETLLYGPPPVIPTDLARVQRRLYSLCYLRQEDFNAQKTADALREFQEVNGLPETGEADHATVGILFTNDARPKPYPYRVEVSLADQTVTVWSLTDQGDYSEVQSFSCSTGLHDSTPSGIFLDGHPVNRWHYFEKYYCWAQYSFRIEGGILFHSVLYREQDESTIKNGSVWALGNPASHGCIRLSVEDAKWLFENCPRGSLAILIS